MEANKDGKQFSSYKDLSKIIEAVKDDFDILIIDTSPYFSAATLTAHYAANNIIVPIRPSENDTDSSEKYFEQLANIYEILAAINHGGYANVLVQPSAVKSNSMSHVETVSRIRSMYHDHCSPVNFLESDAVLNCAKEYSTIYDLSVSEFAQGAKKSLARAQTETLPIIRDIENKSIQFWNK